MKPKATNVLFCFSPPTVRSSDKRIACEEEFSDSEDEGEGGRKNVSNFKKAKRSKTEEEEKEEEEKKGSYLIVGQYFSSCLIGRMCLLRGGKNLPEISGTDDFSSKTSNHPSSEN